MKTIQMQILLPFMIAIEDGAYEVYAARHLRTLQLSRPTQIVYETASGQEVEEEDAPSTLAVTRILVQFR